MMHAAPRIGVAETPQGLLVSLPPRFWLVVSLRRSFRKVAAGAAAWTYLVRDKRAGRRLEQWIAAVELDAIAEARRRAWTATDADWFGAEAPPAPAHRPAEAVVVAIPPKGTARSTLRLIREMQAGQVLVVAVPTLKPRTYRLSPSGRTVKAAVAQRAIEGSYLIPSCDGLFGPDWSQTWRAPLQEKVDVAPKRGRKGRAPADQERQDGASGPVPQPAAGRVRRSARERPQGEVVGHGRRRTVPRRRGVVA